MRIGIKTAVMMGTTVYDSVLSIGVLKIKIHPGNESASHYISTVHFIIETRYTHQSKITISPILKLHMRSYTLIWFRWINYNSYFSLTPRWVLLSSYPTYLYKKEEASVSPYSFIEKKEPVAPPKCHAQPSGMMFS
jgi:hypothetical protein